MHQFLAFLKMKAPTFAESSFNDIIFDGVYATVKFTGLDATLWGPREVLNSYNMVCCYIYWRKNHEFE